MQGIGNGIPAASRDWPTAPGMPDRLRTICAPTIENLSSVGSTAVKNNSTYQLKARRQDVMKWARGPSVGVFADAQRNSRTSRTRSQMPFGISRD
jgi:hypothetical protein